jgi:hypothetical protein
MLPVKFGKIFYFCGILPERQNIILPFVKILDGAVFGQIRFIVLNDTLSEI